MSGSRIIAGCAWPTCVTTANGGGPSNTKHSWRPQSISTTRTTNTTFWPDSRRPARRRRPSGAHFGNSADCRRYLALWRSVRRDLGYLRALAEPAARLSSVACNRRVADFDLPDHIEAQTPAEFAHNTVQLSPVAACQAVREIAARTGRTRPPRTPQQLVDQLENRYAMVDAAAILRHHLS